MPINVVAVEDDRKYRRGLEALFDHAPDFHLAGSYGSAPAALDVVRSARPGPPVPAWDIVLMDLELPRLHGIEATRRVKALLPRTRVVVLTVFEASNTVLEAICAGADGYLIKRTAPEAVLDELRSVDRGGSPLSAGVARTVLELLRTEAGGTDARGGEMGPTRLDLTDRQQDVLRCLVRGMAYKQTASHLGISVETVRSHVKGIYAKLQVQSVAQAVGKAIRRGLI